MTTMTHAPAAARRVIGGVDTHKDVHVAAALDDTGRLLATESFPTTTVGYRRLWRWLGSHGEVVAVGVEGTARLGRRRDAAVLEGAVRATRAGHRIFGADDAALNDLGSRLRAELGDDAYEAAGREGAVLDGDAAVDHALRAL